MSRTVDGVVKAVSSRAASVLVVIAMLTCSGVTFAQDAAAPAAPNPVAEAASAPAA